MPLSFIGCVPESFFIRPSWRMVEGSFEKTTISKDSLGKRRTVFLAHRRELRMLSRGLSFHKGVLS